MNTLETSYVREEDLYAEFGWLTRNVLISWKNYIITYNNLEATQAVVDEMNEYLLTGNAIVLFDHHYAFDALPLGLALGKHIKNVTGVVVPYAVHLDMGVGREGEFSLHYRLRTKAFHWFVGNIARGNQNIQFLPVEREFERDTPRLAKIVDENFLGINTRYLKTLIREFTETPAGQICFMTPFSGIGFPDKPLLHPNLYRSIDLLSSKSEEPIPIYLLGAYPSWRAFSSYYAPLMTQHMIDMRGPFNLPKKDYQAALGVMTDELTKLREMANFSPPDYDQILNK